MGVIFLCGMTGAGKTTVGRRLAEKLRCAFHDVDEEIERRTGKSIPEIFANDGEAAFRSMETHCLEALDLSGDAVVALGAGALESPENLTAVRELGTLVYLRLSLSMLFRRAESLRASRPLLQVHQNADDLQRALLNMLARREAGYLTADRIVDVGDDDTVDVVADRIAADLRFE